MARRTALMCDTSAHVDWPRARSPLFAASAVPSLASAWIHSQKQLQNLRGSLPPLPDSVACVAVSGSFARMECHSHSDVDLIVVLDDRRRHVPDETAAEIIGSIQERVDLTGAARPKPEGIYSHCARWSRMTHAAAKGQVDESLTTFGHRIQLLMDAQPLCGDDLLTDLRHDILQWYSETRLLEMFSEPGRFHWLWQDVQRYWRSLRSRTCWLDAHNICKSLSLNIKLRSSRLVLVFAFLLSIVNAESASNPSQHVARLVADLRRTPLERLFGNGGQQADKGMAAYDCIWRFLQTSAVNPTSKLPAEVNSALQELAVAVRQVTIAQSSGRDPDRWFM